MRSTEPTGAAAKAPPKRVASRPAKVTIGAVALPESKTFTADPSNPAENDLAMTIDAKVIRTALKDELRRLGYEDVETQEERAKSTVGGGALKPEDMGFVLDTRFKSASLGRDQEADTSGFSLVSWLFLGWISSFISDHTYVCKLEPVFTLRDPMLRRQPQVFETKPGRSRSTFDLHKRRDGSGAFVATIFLAPPFAFGSTPSELSKALVPACLQDPVKELDERLTGTKEVHSAVVRALEGIRAKHPNIRFELTSPTPGSTQSGSQYRVILTVQDPGPDRISRIVIGDKEFTRTSTTTVATHDVTLDPRMPVRVTIVTNLGSFPVFDLTELIERR